MSRNIRLAIGAAGVIIVLGVVVSQFASNDPDGLEFVAEQEGFADAAQDHTLQDAPLADYGDPGRSRAVSALVGIAVTLGVGFVLFRMIGSGTHRGDEPAEQGKAPDDG